MLRLIICQNLKSDSLNAPYISIQEVHNLVGVFLPMFISFYKKDETDYSYNNKTWEENDGIRRCFIVHSILTRPPNSKIFGPALAWPYRRTILHLSYSLPTLCQLHKKNSNKPLSDFEKLTCKPHSSWVHVSDPYQRASEKPSPSHTHMPIYQPVAIHTSNILKCAKGPEFMLCSCIVTSLASMTYKYWLCFLPFSQPSSIEFLATWSVNKYVAVAGADAGNMSIRFYTQMQSVGASFMVEVSTTSNFMYIIH